MARHSPHLYLPRPWDSAELALGDEHSRHLHKVLRLGDGAGVSYTDGEGGRGEGVLSGGSVVRGAESMVPRPQPKISVAVAPPRKLDRVRFLVEKLAELGVDRIIWLETRYGEGRPPRAGKAESWAQSALEQSRGSWLVRLDGPMKPHDLPDLATLWVADRESFPPPSVVKDGILLIGSEGGFAEGEIPASAIRFSLGTRVLRVETAALAGAVILLDRSGRLAPPSEIP